MEIVIWKYIEAALENVAENGRDECWGGPCYPSGPKRLFSLPVWLPRTAKKTYFLKKIRVEYILEKLKVLPSRYPGSHHHFELAYQCHWPCWLCALPVWPSLHGWHPRFAGDGLPLPEWCLENVNLKKKRGGKR